VYPLHLVFLLIFVGVEFARLAAATMSAHAPGGPVFSGPEIFSALIAHLFLLHGLGISIHEVVFNGPSWSISVEFFMYLLFGMLVLRAGKFVLPAATVISVLAMAALWLPAEERLWMLLRGLAGFFAGCVASGWAGRVSAADTRWPAGAPVVPAAALCLLLGFKAPYASVDFLIYPITAWLVVALVVSRDGAPRRLLRCHPLVRLGTLSYSIYMSHVLALVVVNRAVRVFLDRPEAAVARRLVPQLGLSEALLACCIVLALVVALSFLSYRLIEQPCREWSRRVAFAAAR
jgi:peptidoglycan/LPS O-acetylase OafA/YrhL